MLNKYKGSGVEDLEKGLYNHSKVGKPSGEFERPQDRQGGTMDRTTLVLVHANALSGLNQSGDLCLRQ